MTETLDSAQIIKFISPDHQRQLSQIDIFQSLASTNTYLLELAKQPLPSGYVCLAEEQTQGRGRQGNTWYSPKYENIYCSLLWNFPSNVKDISALSLAVGVMLVNALQKISIHGLQLKWPNDIYYQQRKLAGILIEALPSRKKMYPVVIGLGINIQSPDFAIGINRILDTPPSRNQILGTVLNELIAGLPRYITNRLDPFLSEFNDYDMLRGKFGVVRTGNAEIPGVVEGINAEGALSLRDELGKTHLFRCGEVSIVLNKQLGGE